MLYGPLGHIAVKLVGPPSEACGVKVPWGSQVAIQQGGKLKSLTSALPGVKAGVAEVQPPPKISFSKMAANQAANPSTLQAIKSSSLTVRIVQVEWASLLCDIVWGITRPLVPEVDRPSVFQAIHSVAHPGMCSTKQMISACFVWKGVGKDVGAMCRDCQHGKIHKQADRSTHP
jgi:hypothetical protein